MAREIQRRTIKSETRLTNLFWKLTHLPGKSLKFQLFCPVDLGKLFADEFDKLWTSYSTSHAKVVSKDWKSLIIYSVPVDHLEIVKIVLSFSQCAL